MRVGVDLLDVDGAGISLIDGREHRGSLASSDGEFARVDDLQFELGEGPGIDAARTSSPVLEPDLRRCIIQWPGFAPAAIALGVLAHFSFPLQVGAAKVGVLSLHRRAPGDLSDEHAADALTLARIAVNVVLDTQTPLSASDLDDRLGAIADHRSSIHQATGMIAAQLETDVANALVRLRSHAWAHDLSIDAVAQAVIRRELRFEA